MITPMIRAHIFLLFLINYLIADAAEAQNGLYRDSNLREACRKQAAGFFLDLKNEISRSQSYIDHLGTQLERLKKARQESQKNLLEIRKKAESMPFQMELIQQKDAAEHSLLLIEQTIDEHSSMLKTHKETLLQAKQTLRQYQKKLKDIFVIREIPSRQLKDRFEISYIRSCPPYRDSCPLSKNDANKLLTLFDPAPTPTVCFRYAHFLNW